MLSVIIITKNAERTIRLCLGSIKTIASEIVIVDSGSTDNTLSICREYTNNIYSMDWPGYGIQKQRALDKATCEWVLSLDADEVVTAKLAEEIVCVMEGSHYFAYMFNRVTVYNQKQLRHCIGRDKCLRLFKREKACFSTDVVHEAVVTSYEVGLLVCVPRTTPLTITNMPDIYREKR